MSSYPLPPVGSCFRVPRVFPRADFDRFAALGGDNNPIHVGPGVSAAIRFGRTVAHGMLLYSALRGVIRARFPAVRQIEQQLMFPAPTYAEEAMELEVEDVGRSDHHDIESEQGTPTHDRGVERRPT